jgi:hypothetical protein
LLLVADDDGAAGADGIDDTFILIWMAHHNIARSWAAAASCTARIRGRSGGGSRPRASLDSGSRRRADWSTMGESSSRMRRATSGGGGACC